MSASPLSRIVEALGGPIGHYVTQCTGDPRMQWRLQMPSDAYERLLNDSLDFAFPDGTDLHAMFRAFNFITVHLPNGGTLTIERYDGEAKRGVEGPGAGGGGGVPG